jgi:hypothetical protein
VRLFGRSLSTKRESEQGKKGEEELHDDLRSK